jgi:hypothetical protein
MKKYPSQEMDRFNVRLPAGMRDAIADLAKENGRSMNSEIIAAIEMALQMNAEPAQLTPDTATKIIEDVIDKKMTALTGRLDQLEKTINKKPT